MEFIALLLFLVWLCDSSRRRGTRAYPHWIVLEKNIRESTEELEKLKIKELEEAIRIHGQAICEALDNNRSYVLTLPCAYRFVMESWGKYYFEPCSENLFV